MDYCKTCVYYPPSSCDGKPCTQCDITNPFLTCYREKEFIVKFFQQERKPTNADRIRSMTDEKLAEWYFDKFFPCVPYCSMLQDGCPEHDDCKICLLEWLKQESKE